ncbi:ATP-grasp domain-containing protein [Prauserella cavernicola]|uniref:ATP-grasp domain-containing protein n=1 Tax=Prauserella cavernicola TaxID=2800127 RepID=A0A934V747_9PSEU|nr:hypothetical protein [Prauserella cavernicola]MBK1788202.1 hypothetical protein [Prauserella cavernicola]
MSRTAILVGCARLPEGDGDEAGAQLALADVGVGTRWAVWDDPGEDFTDADLVILRATWDYSARRDAFLDWCASVAALRNAADVVRWNTDKAYLLDLAGAGIPIVPTQLLGPGDAPDWPDGDVVVKPSVGAGSRGAARFGTAQRAEATAHLSSLREAGHSVLLQPYQHDVDREGETALVFFGGGYSHAFTKGAMLTGAQYDESGLFVTEKLGLAEPEAAYRALAEDVLDATAARFGIGRSELLYARVDVVRTDGGTPAILELELAEPSLGFRQAGPGSAARFASAVRRELG